jgi:hypothetical protein
MFAATNTPGLRPNLRRARSVSAALLLLQQTPHRHCVPAPDDEIDATGDYLNMVRELLNDTLVDG